MPTYQAPGVYVEEIDGGPQSLSAGATAVAAFVGFTERGPWDEDIRPDDPESVHPRLITTWAEFQKLYGGFVPDATMPQSVFGFFQNGGSQAYIARVPHLDPEQDDTPQVTVPEERAKGAPEPEVDGGGGLSLTIKARPGAGPGLDVVITRGADAYNADLEAAAMTARSQAVDAKSAVTAGGDAPATDIEALNTAAVEAEQTAVAARQATYILKVRQGGSVKYAQSNVLLGDIAGISTVPEGEIEPLVDFVVEGATDTAVLTPGTYLLAPVRSTRAVTPAMFTGADDATGSTGLNGLDAFEDVTMVLMPDLHRVNGGGDEIGFKAVQSAVVTHCELHKDRVAILDSPQERRAPDEVAKWRSEIAMIDSKFATLYYPWLRVSNPEGGMLSVPPSGHVAGIWARTDAEVGPWKAPANAIVRGALDLDFRTTMVQQGQLNPEGINCIRGFGSEGFKVWGARTLSSDTNWRYVNVRRLFNMVEDTIKGGTNWVVFEPNDVGTWGRVRGTIDGFLRGLWRQGALAGATPAEAYFIKCDPETNPPDVVARGEMVIEIGIAPVKPAEFVIFRVSQFQPSAS